MWRHALAVLGLGLLLAGWVLFQRWVKRHDPGAPGVEGGCGACGGKPHRHEHEHEHEHEHDA